MKGLHFLRYLKRMNTSDDESKHNNFLKTLMKIEKFN